MSTRKKGIEGEAWAKAFLEEKGYKILESNWRFKKYEIDILAKQNDELIVVEVKRRSTNKFGEPEQFVSNKKQKYLIEAAEAYLEQNSYFNSTRFDVISIIENFSEKRIRHYTSAFYPEIEDL